MKWPIQANHGLIADPTCAQAPFPRSPPPPRSGSVRRRMSIPCPLPGEPPISARAPCAPLPRGLPLPPPPPHSVLGLSPALHRLPAPSQAWASVPGKREPAGRPTRGWQGRGSARRGGSWALDLEVTLVRECVLLGLAKILWNLPLPDLWDQNVGGGSRTFNYRLISQGDFYLDHNLRIAILSPKNVWWRKAGEERGPGAGEGRSSHYWRARGPPSPPPLDQRQQPVVLPDLTVKNHHDKFTREPG